MKEEQEEQITLVIGRKNNSEMQSSAECYQTTAAQVFDNANYLTLILEYKPDTNCAYYEDLITSSRV